ncbi:MAG: hypothetical protein KDL31_13205, partial [Kiritimatiellae bacterium]|nr:hypothetical protein [Kiritimatiellia bacterium]
MSRLYRCLDRWLAKTRRIGRLIPVAISLVVGMLLVLLYEWLRYRAFPGSPSELVQTLPMLLIGLSAALITYIGLTLYHVAADQFARQQRERKQ